MKFITESGTIEEGVALTDLQVRCIETFALHLHATVCEGNYHSLYKPKPCYLAAACLVSKIGPLASSDVYVALRGEADSAKNSFDDGSQADNKSSPPPDPPPEVNTDDIPQ